MFYDQKLDVSSFIEGQWSFTKLGRMNKLDIETIIPIIIKATESM